MYAFKESWLAESTHVLFNGTQVAIPIASLFDFPFSLIVTVPLSVCLALLATFLTPTTDISLLKSFHRKVQAGGWGWRKIDRLVREEEPAFRARSPLNLRNTALWILSSLAICLWLIGLGKLIIGDAFINEPFIGSRTLGVMMLLAGSLCLGCVAILFPHRAVD